MLSLHARAFGRVVNLKRSLIKRYYRRQVLRKLKTSMRPCVLCGNNQDFKLLFETDRYGLPIRTEECLQCGLVQTRPTPTPDFLDWFYSSHAYRGLYQGKLFARAGKDNDDSFRRAKMNTDFVLRHISLPHGASVLDFGSADGEILLSLRRARPDLKIYGLEPGSNYAAANAEKFDGFYSSIDELPAGQQFDLITTYHVIEHLYNPVEILGILSDHLKPDGRLLFATPCQDHYYVTGIGNYHIGHLHHFSRRIVDGIAEKINRTVELYKEDVPSRKSYGMWVILR